MDRREFLKNIARASILVGLGALTGSLLIKDNESESCNYNFICSNCNKLSKCVLPEAIKFKETGKLRK